MAKKPSWLEQNPCDYYNINHSEDAVKILLSRDKRLSANGKDIDIRIDSRNKKPLLKKSGVSWNVLDDNDLGLVKGMSYSPFQILTRFRFHNNFKAAFTHVGLTYMDMDFPYIRIGVKYFKVVDKIDRFGVVRELLLVWSKDEIKQDYGKEMLDRVSVYDDFIISPDNMNYKKSVRGFYNLYAPFPHKKTEFDTKDLSKIKWSMTLMKHIFGRQLDLGLKYLKVLYENPKQPLPILVLTSEERQTGKSTFIDWFSIIFGGNMVIINPQDIGSSFNSSYATKNIIAIEESRFDSVQTTEKLKALATQKTLSVNTKFVSPYDTPFYGKLIITSNYEHKFSRVDEAEIRYWVRKIPTLSGVANHSILDDLTEEIPYFLHYLSQLPDIDFSKSRQVFTSEEIETSALAVVKRESKDGLQKDIEIIFDDYCSNNEDEEFLHFIPIDIKNTFFKNDSRISVNYVTKILKDKMKLEREEVRGRYTPTFDDSKVSKMGQYFTFKNPYYNTENNTNLKQEDYDQDDIF